MTAEAAAAAGADPAGPADLVGRTFGSSRPYDVGREKIREFATAVGDTSPAYLDPEAARALGHRDVIAPPTFPIVVAFEPLQAMLDDLGLPLHQIMHADQKFTAHRPIHPGDRLAATLTIESVRQVGDSRLFSTRTVITDEAGEPVVTASAKVVDRSGQA